MAAGEVAEHERAEDSGGSKGAAAARVRGALRLLDAIPCARNRVAPHLEDPPKRTVGRVVMLELHGQIVPALATDVLTLCT